MFNFSEIVLDHFYHPRNVGEFDRSEKNIGTGVVGTKHSGTVMRLQICIDKRGFIEDTCFKTYGCPSCIAATSLVSEWLKGKTLEHAKEITSEQIIKTLELPREKYYCGLLAEDVIKAAVEDVRLLN